MAASGLFPPVLDTYMPAFLDKAGDFKINFDISDFNSAGDISTTVQVSVRDQYSNENLLKSPIEIVFKDYEIDTNTNQKYVKINKTEDLIGSSFVIGKIYKIQLRFISSTAQHINQSITFINDNLDKFSEWSTVCLIKCISEPILSVTLGNKQDDKYVFQQDFSTIYGSLTFTDKNDSETPKSYRILLQERGRDYAITHQDSGILYFDTDSNSFSYKLKYQLRDSIDYYLVVQYSTKFGYSGEKEYEIIYSPDSSIEKNFSVQALPQSEVGRNKIEINFNENVDENIIIKRSSNLNNFIDWEDIHIKYIHAQEGQTYTWYDYTVESGVWYKYAVQSFIKDTKGQYKYSTSIITEKPIINVFDDIFLNANGLQLKIKYNPQIGSFSRVISDSKVDTIGSKYPFFSRNGIMSYRSFPINGLISFLSDEQELEDDETQCNLFTSRSKIYGNSQYLYDEYNLENNINSYNDILYERKFREKVMDFLYANNVKLFRSTQEGNILVKLMDISFTPEAQLGRMIYSFSATAHEADECSIENYDKYNIQTIGTIISEQVPVYTKSYYVMGQIYSNTVNNNSLLSIIESKLQQQDNRVYIKSFSHLKITFQTPPYLIKADKSGELKVADKNDKNAYLGYIITINNRQIAVNPDGIYELENNAQGYSIIQFDIDRTKSPQYIVDYIVKAYYEVLNKEEADKAVEIIQSENIPTTNIGQLQSVYNVGYDIIQNELKGKNITAISIEGEANQVCYIKTSKDAQSQRYSLGVTEFLCINNNSTIESLSFGGIRLTNSEFNPTLFVEDNGTIKYKYNNILYDIKAYDNDLQEISSLTNKSDAITSAEVDVLMPVSAIINYQYTIEE